MSARLDAATILGLIADISRHDQAAPLILGQGRAAVPTLIRFLDGSPVSVPHARRFAVAMLAHIAGTEATVGLRRTLHGHDLQALAPDVAHAEWLVQNDAFAALATRPDVDIAVELDYGLDRARLPAAVATVAALGRTERISTLVALLTDDILDHPAQDALCAFGSAALPALEDVLRRPIVNADALKRTLAVVAVLDDISDSAVSALLEPLLDASHPALAAGTALNLLHRDSAVTTDKLAPAVIRGVLLPTTDLADRCREALGTLPAATLERYGMAALELDTLPDLYGDPQPISASVQACLLAALLRRAEIDIATAINRLPTRLLTDALRKVEAIPNPANLQALLQHPAVWIRAAAARFVTPDTN